MSREEAQGCESALSFDPGNYQFRSCSLVFDLMGNTERGMEFLRLDLGSGWVGANLPLHFERAGKPAEARESAKKIPADDPVSGLLVACLDQSPAAKLDTEISASMPVVFADPFAENRNWNATLFATCVKHDIDVGVLIIAIAVHAASSTSLLTESF